MKALPGDLPGNMRVLSLVSITLLPADAASNSNDIDFNAVDRYITDKMWAPRIFGVALVIIKGDQIIYLKGYGQADSSSRQHKVQIENLG